MINLAPNLASVHSLGFNFVSGYQRFHGLKPDNILGPITAESINEPRFCSRPDREEIKDSLGQLLKWPTNRLTVSIKSTIPNFTLGQSRNIVIDALNSWGDVANLDFTFDHSADSNVNIHLTVGPIDGPSGTLAWSELPNRSNKVLQKYDQNEAWVLSSNPPQNKIDILAVMVHELGHALGLSHAPQSERNNAIMAPFYNPEIRSPLSHDINRIQALYGKSTTPSPTNPNPTNGDGDQTPQISGKILVKSITWTPNGLILDIDEVE